MSNFENKTLFNDFEHTFLLGDAMEKEYANKKINFSFYFNQNGLKLKDILEECYKVEIRNEKILVGGKNNDFQKEKNDGIMHT